MKNNLIKSFGNTMVKSAHKVKYQTIKHSPEICIIAGIAGVIGSTILACYATTKVVDVVDGAKEEIDDIHARVEEGECNEIEEKEELTSVYVKTGTEVLKLYAPAVILGALSITSLLASHHIMRKRNAELAAAYSTLYAGFKEYRNRVAEKYGEDAEKEIRYGIKREQIEEKTVDKNGKEKTKKTEVTTLDPNNISPYARIYDDGCVGWTKDPEYNRLFLLKQQALANEKLKRQGYLWLNDVYEMLGFQPTKDGHVAGWIYDEKHPVGDNFVDFGIWDINDPNKRRFVNGYERNIILDFNVDGNIYEKM